MCGVVGHLAPVHRCVRLVFCFVCAVSWAIWLLFSGVSARCVASFVRCPGPLRSCSPVCWLGALCGVCRVMGHLTPVHRCARSMRCIARTVSGATWFLSPGVLARYFMLCVRCPGPFGSCSPVCPLGVFCRVVVSRVRCPGPLGPASPVCPLSVLCRVCGVLGGLALVHCCDRPMRCVVCAVSSASWFLLRFAHSVCCVPCVRFPGPFGSCSPVCVLAVLCCVRGVLGHLAPVRRCAYSLCCVACAVSWATWLLFAGVLAQCVVLRVCVVLGILASIHRCARSVCCVVFVWCPGATWLLFTSVPARCVVWCAQCPGPLGSCPAVCSLSASCCVCALSWATWLPFTSVPAPCVVLCVCGVPSHLAPVHQCARSVCCVACPMSRATWLLFTSVHARCVALPLCRVLGHLAPDHRCPCSLCCVACAVSPATWLLFTGVLARFFLLCPRCPGPLGSCSPVCLLDGLFRVCGVPGHLAPVHRCVFPWCFVLHVRCRGPLGSCSPVCWPGVLFCVCDVLSHLAPVHRCVGSVFCFVCAVSWATWLLFTSVPAWFVVLRVRCPWPSGSCSAVCPLGVLCHLCGVMGHLAPVHQCVGSLHFVACALSWAT